MEGIKVQILTSKNARTKSSYWHESFPFKTEHTSHTNTRSFITCNINRLDDTKDDMGQYHGRQRSIYKKKISYEGCIED